MPWTRPRIVLVACAAASALAMLYVGLFQIDWFSRLACPGFGSGCESVALAPFSYPLGLADGLLWGALGGLICAVAQLQQKEAAAALAVLGLLDLLIALILVLQMHKLGVFCLWTTLSAVLSVPVAALAALGASESRGRAGAAVAPDEGGEQ